MLKMNLCECKEPVEYSSLSKRHETKNFYLLIQKKQCVKCTIIRLDESNDLLFIYLFVFDVFSIKKSKFRVSNEAEVAGEKCEGESDAFCSVIITDGGDFFPPLLIVFFWSWQNSFVEEWGLELESELVLCLLINGVQQYHRNSVFVSCLALSLSYEL